MKKILLIFALIFAAIAVTLWMSRVDTSKENSVRLQGVVSKIYEGGVKDAVFVIENDKVSYYINRGLENKFNLTTLQKNLIGKEVVIFYAKNWTPLAPFGTKCKHMTRLESGGKTIYSEF